MSVLRSTGILALAAAVAISMASPGYAKNGDNNGQSGLAFGLTADNHEYNGVGMGHIFAIGEGHHKDGAVNVPEIDAASGLAALAVILAGLTLAWERRRRYV